MDTLRWLGSVFSEVVIVFCAEAQWGDGRQTFRVGCPAWVHWVHLKGRQLRRISKELRATTQKVGSWNLAGQTEGALCGEGFISNEGELRLAVSKILKNNHGVRTVYGLMFYSIVLRLNLVSLRVGKVHGGNDLLVQNNLVVFPSIPELLPIRRFHATKKFSSHAKIHLAKRRSKTLRPPPLHHIFRVCPRLPNQCAWGIKNSGDNHPLFLVNRVFCHF